MSQLYHFFYRFVPVLMFVFAVGTAEAQRTTPRNATLETTNAPQTTLDSRGRIVPNRQDSIKGLEHRDNSNDTITIFFRYFDSTRIRLMDSSINDFTKRFPVPYTYNTLSNYGNAAQPLVFAPILKAGWDPGFHSYDIYRFKVEDTRFFQTTRPYTELAYLLGSKAEQTIHLLHTQNKKSNLNFALEYRFINAPGAYRNQNANHNNTRLNAVYQSNNKRYSLYFMYIANKLKGSENGGLKNPADLGSLAFNDPFEIETRMGNYAGASRNPFNTTITTGNTYKDNHILLRQQYDFGQKDSLVTDSITYRYFYPRFRLQHTLRISGYTYSFSDVLGDSASYRDYFNYGLKRSTDSVFFEDRWKEVLNEFSIITFPEKNNLNQFIKLGAALQNLKAFIGTGTSSYYNIAVSGEYRNRTRNQVWDIEANGQLFVTGLNAGDYQAFVSLKRLIGKKYGYLEIGFQNVNRTPSVIYEGITNFPVKNAFGFKKENTIRIFANYELPKQQLKLSAEYYLLTNYSYFDSMYSVKQEGNLFNLLHISAEKKFKLSRRWNLYSEVHIQQYTGNPPVRVPFFLTRNRLAFEGNFYKNLFLSTGVEIRYHTNFKASGYSPIMGQFYFQDNYSLTNRPDVNAFFNFRIKSFKAFIRGENLNTFLKKSGSANNFNQSRQYYVNPAFWLRVGIFWNFVN